MPDSLYFLEGQSLSAVEPTVAGSLLRVAVALNEGTTVDRLIDILFDVMEPIVPFDRIGLARLMPDGALETIHVRSTLPITWGVGVRSRIEGTSLEPIVKEGKIRIIRDLGKILEKKPTSRSASKIFGEGIRSSLALPLSAHNKIIGVLFFSSVLKDVYCGKHVEFFRLIAATIGIAFERADLVESLKAAKKEMESLDRLKSQFLSNLSHEMRTPLAVVLGNAIELKEGTAGPLSAIQQAYVHEVIDGAEHLANLFDDLFDFTALESGRFEFEFQQTDLAPFVQEICAEAAPRFKAAGLDFACRLPECPVVVSIDPPHFAKAIEKLLDNALKFTPAPGTVRVFLRVRQGKARLAVSDTGVGISEANHRHIFKRFFQAHGEATREKGGSGLGLALAKAIIEQHGGRIHLRSKPRSGSIFTLELPISGSVPAT